MTSSYASNLCLLEDKVQDPGMYLFTISYGSDAMDGQGDGVPKAGPETGGGGLARVPEPACVRSPF